MQQQLQLVSVSKAAEMLTCSHDTVRRVFRGKMVQVSRRRVAIRLSDILQQIGGASA